MARKGNPNDLAILLAQAWVGVSSSSTDYLVSMDVNLDEKAKLKITAQDASLVSQCTAMPACFPACSAHSFTHASMFLRTWNGAGRCWSPC